MNSRSVFTLKTLWHLIQVTISVWSYSHLISYLKFICLKEELVMPWSLAYKVLQCLRTSRSTWRSFTKKNSALNTFVYKVSQVTILCYYSESKSMHFHKPIKLCFKNYCSSNFSHLRTPTQTLSCYKSFDWLCMSVFFCACMSWFLFSFKQTLLLICSLILLKQETEVIQKTYQR